MSPSKTKNCSLAIYQTQILQICYRKSKIWIKCRKSFNEIEKHLKREKGELEAFNDVMLYKKNFETKKEAAVQK